MKSSIAQNLAQKNDFVKQSLDLRRAAKVAKNWIKWSIFNLLGFLIFIYDINCACFPVKWNIGFLLECGIAFVFAFNCIVYFLRYMIYIVERKCVKGSEYQRFLLDIDSNDTSFVTEEPTDQKKELTDRKEELDSSSPVINWHSSFSNTLNRSYNRSPSGRFSPPLLTSPNQTMDRSSYHNSSHHSALNSSLNASVLSSGRENSLLSTSHEYSGEILSDSKSVRRFLKQIEELEKKNSANQSSVYQANRSNTVDSFWNYCNSAANMLKTTIYQLAPIESDSAQNKQASHEEGGVLNSITSNSAVINRISSDKLSHYVGNIRMWICNTILKRIVYEIENANLIFSQRGFVDLQIGGVGLDRIRKMTENQQFISHCMPALPMLLPYLELCNNQEYLVRRMRELAEGVCFHDYRWNSGGDYNNQKWGEHLPTDSAIIFHLLCTYLDGQLMPLPQGGGRPFYSRYVIVREGNHMTKEIVNSIHNKAHCAILCSNPSSKPKFNFISDNQVHNCPFDRNNLFYVIIQFLIYMRTNNDSMLEGVSLGKGGISIMCVIE